MHANFDVSDANDSQNRHYNFIPCANQDFDITINLRLASACMIQRISGGPVTDALFDISYFTFTIPAKLDPTCLVDMNGVRFYGGQPWKQTAGGYTFGGDAPTFVLIGRVYPTFTPVLLAYGTVSLNNSKGGINFYNYVGWTQGLYTVANLLSTPTQSAQVVGGMSIQPFDGGFYTDSLINDGTDFAIKTFAKGAVTTTAPNSFVSGQKLQFSDLANPSGGVGDGDGYFVETVLSVTEFTISALDGHDVSQAAADAGT